jgi:hypothetical protein
MSSYSYVFSCLFATDECDEYGLDCCFCPFYNDNEDDDDEE